MAMTITEANAVNTLLMWLLEDGKGGPDIPTWENALGAAATLAQSASKSLGAGVNESWVYETWGVKNRSGKLRRRRASVRSGKAGR